MDASTSENTLLRNASLIPCAMAGGVLLFAGIVAFLTLTGREESTNSFPSTPWVFVSLGLGVASQSLSSFLVQKRQASFLGEKGPQHYLQLQILRFAVLEGPALVGLVFLLLSVHPPLSQLAPMLGFHLVPRACPIRVCH